MGADINHTADKSLVPHGRHGDEHLPVEIASFWTFWSSALLALLPGKNFRCPGFRCFIVIIIGRGRARNRDPCFANGHVEMLPHCAPIATVAACGVDIGTSTLRATTACQGKPELILPSLNELHFCGELAAAHDEFNG